MGYLIFLAFCFTFMGGIMVGTNTATTIVRQETIYRCIQKPKECKKEFDFYQLKKEVQAMRENQK